MNRLYPGRRNSRHRGASVRRNKSEGLLQTRGPLLKKVILTVLISSLLLLIGLNSRTIVKDINQQKIEFVAIEGSLSKVSENDIKEIVFGFINQSMVAIDLNKIQYALEENPWIKTVSLRRKWPDTLMINVKEEIAIARWGQTQLLNQEGMLFAPPSVIGAGNLAELSGPVGSELRVMEQYQVFNQLLYPKNLRIASLNLNSRGAWTMKFNNEIYVAVGSIRPVEKVRRFAGVYETLFAGQIAAIEAFDLRYEDGIAVRHKSPTTDALISMQTR
mgnify:CR=1 FL=1|tara:strand:+ start:54619 stop:55440 length:822 start_codon:yes stop_codon:yes gene_type:complete